MLCLGFAPLLSGQKRKGFHLAFCGFDLARLGAFRDDMMVMIDHDLTGYDSIAIQ